MKIHVKLLYAALLVFISAAGISLYSTETKAANAAINQLPAAGAIAGTDIIPITQGGTPVLARQAPMSAVDLYLQGTGNYILSSVNFDQVITSTAPAPGLSIVGNFAEGLYGQYEIKDILNQNYHFTVGVSSVDNAAKIWAGNAGVGIIPIYLQSEGGSYIGIGSNGNQSYLNIYPATTNNGVLQLTASNSTGNFSSILTNANVGQSTTYTLVDPGQSTANIIVSASTAGQTIGGPLTVTGKLSSPTFTATGITGAAQTSRYAGATTSGAPASGTFSVGDYIVALDGSMYVATASGTPGTWSAVGSRNNLVTGVFGRTGAITATSGDYSTNLVTENTNLYFTTPRVLATALTGFSTTNSAIVATDTVLQGFNKTQGQLNAIVSGVSSVFGRTGAVVAATGDYTQNQITNLTTASSPTFAAVTATGTMAAGTHASTGGWLSGIFGGTSGNRVVMGLLNGAASIGAHNFALSAWAPLYIQPENAAFTAFGLSAIGAQTPNATIHGGGSTILGTAFSAVADASIYNGQTNVWADDTNVDLVFKRKNNSGTIQNFYGVRRNVRTITANYTNVAGDDFIFIDTTLGNILLTVDVTKIGKTGLTIVNYSGVGLCQFQSASGQFIDGINGIVSIATQWSSRTINQTPSSVNGVITATKGA